MLAILARSKEYANALEVKAGMKGAARPLFSVRGAVVRIIKDILCPLKTKIAGSLRVGACVLNSKIDRYRGSPNVGAAIGRLPDFSSLSSSNAFINDKIFVKGTTRATKSRSLPS